MDRDWLEQCVLHHFPTEKERITQLINSPQVLEFARSTSNDEPLFLVSLV